MAGKRKPKVRLLLSAYDLVVKEGTTKPVRVPRYLPDWKVGDVVKETDVGAPGGTAVTVLWEVVRIDSRGIWGVIVPPHSTAK